MERKEQQIARQQRSQPACRCTGSQTDDEDVDADLPLCLLDIPPDILRPIIAFSALENPNERWFWLNDIGATCRIFHTISKKLAPRELVLEQTFVPQGEDPDTYLNRISFEQLAPLLRSFLSARWKGANLVKFVVNRETCRGSNSDLTSQPIVDALRSLLKAPQLFPQLETLCIAVWSNSIIDAEVLADFGRNFPKLRRLIMHGCFSPERVTPAIFGAFGESLQQPLHALSLARVCWMTDAHVEEFLHHHKGANNIRGLHLNYCHEDFARLSDLTAESIAQHCHQLKQISLVNTAVTSSGLHSILLANNGDLTTVNVSDCDRLAPDIVDLIIEHAPKLESLGVNGCRWFTNDFLMRLIKGQQRKSLISLRHLEILGSSVTHAGLRRALEWAQDAFGDQGSIYIGCTRTQLLDGKLEPDELPYLISSSLEEWRAISQDFPRVEFAEFPYYYHLGVSAEQEIGE